MKLQSKGKKIKRIAVHVWHIIDTLALFLLVHQYIVHYESRFRIIYLILVNILLFRMLDARLYEAGLKQLPKKQKFKIGKDESSLKDVEI